MKLDKMTVNIRPVSSYEAIDLGLAVARAFYWDLLKLWLSRAVWVMLPMLLCLWWLGREGSGVSNLGAWLGALFWLLKPYYELPMLAYLSQKLFDEKFALEDTKSVLAGMNPTKNALNMVLRHRFSLKRCSVMAVRLLEGQTGKALHKRVQLLSRKNSNAHSMHTWVFYHIELILYFGWMYLWFELFSSYMISDESVGFLDTLAAMPLSMVILTLLTTLAVVGFVAPFFVASGFVIYLCQRSLLEAWDVELIFRKLALRYRHHQASQRTTSKTKGGDA